jgi:hypothetical protein
MRGGGGGGGGGGLDMYEETAYLENTVLLFGFRHLDTIRLSGFQA